MYVCIYHGRFPLFRRVTKIRSSRVLGGTSLPLPRSASSFMGIKYRGGDSPSFSLHPLQSPFTTCGEYGGGILIKIPDTFTNTWYNIGKHINELNETELIYLSIRLIIFPFIPTPFKASLICISAVNLHFHLGILTSQYYSGHIRGKIRTYGNTTLDLATKVLKNAKFNQMAEINISLLYCNSSKCTDVFLALFGSKSNSCWSHWVGGVGEVFGNSTLTISGWARQADASWPGGWRC